jgi:hypothetical protein
MRERPGWKWNETGSGGYWSKITGESHKHKLPFFCPYEKCEKKITGTIDDEYLLKYGICRTCYTLYVDERKTPLIDVEKYRKRLQEKGY